MRRVARIIVLILTVVGFLLGYYWNDLSPIVEPLAASLLAIWDKLEIFVSTHPAEAGLVFAFIGAIILPVSLWVWNLGVLIVRRRPIIDIIFNKEDHVYVVTSHMKQTSFERIGRNQIIRLPANTPFLPSNVAISAALIYSYARRLYGDGKPALLFFDNENWGANVHSFISIGGPFVNEIARHVAEVKRIPNFEITDVPIAIDEKDRFEAERENSSTTVDAPLVTDCGFIICMENPWNPLKKACIIFGLWPPGVQGGVSAALDPTRSSSRMFKRFYKAVKKGRNVIGIVKVNVKGLIVERSEFVKVREF